MNKRKNAAVRKRKKAVRARVKDFLRLADVARKLGMVRQNVWRDKERGKLRVVFAAGIPMVEPAEFRRYAKTKGKG